MPGWRVHPHDQMLGMDLVGGMVTGYHRQLLQYCPEWGRVFPDVGLGRQEPWSPPRHPKGKPEKQSSLHFSPKSFQELLKLQMSVCVNINSQDYTIYM